MSILIAVDGATSTAIYEHVARVANVNGKVYAGWLEITGGGVAREGQNYVTGAGDEPRGLTDGKAVPQDITSKWEIRSWEMIKADLRTLAASRGDSSTTNYQKVPFQLVDQYRSLAPGVPSKTITYTVKIMSDKPDTPSDGKEFRQEVVFKQTNVPREDYT